MHYKWDKANHDYLDYDSDFFLFAGMMGLILWTEGDIPKLHRPEMHVIALASLIGILLPVSFALVTIRIMNRPSLAESKLAPKKKAKSNSKRAVRKKQVSCLCPQVIPSSFHNSIHYFLIRLWDLGGIKLWFKR